MKGLSLFVFAFTLAACRPEAADPAQAASPEPAAAPVTAVSDDAPLVTVYKSPTCGCCSMWAEYMGREGFRVETRDVADVRVVADSLGMPADLSSCHIATVEAAEGGPSYVVEGHVPADPIRRLLDEQPDARGLTVPGMPLGSPGMEQGDTRQPYDVLLVTNSGEAAVYESVPGSEG